MDPNDAKFIVVAGLASIISLGIVLIELIWKPIRSFLQRPSIRIAVADPPNKAGENWLEWIHLKVENAARTVAHDARLWAHIDGERQDLVWATKTQTGPQANQDLQQGHPLDVPLVIRGRQDFTLPRYCPNLSLQGDVCYLSGNQLLIQCNPTCVLKAGIHRIKVTVTFTSNEQIREASAVFILEVPSKDSGHPITLRKDIGTP
jgi:hypothetical protein